MDKSKFNLSKEQVDVAFTTNKTMSYQDAMDQFGIESIELPLKDGTLQEVRNGFVGSVDVHLKGGSVLSLSLMRSRYENSQNAWYIPQVRSLSRLGYPQGTSSNTHIGVGNALERQAKDGTPVNYASVFIAGTMYQFITQYVNTAANGIEYTPKPEEKQQSDQNQNSDGAVK